MMEQSQEPAPKQDQASSSLSSSVEESVKIGKEVASNGGAEVDFSRDDDVAFASGGVVSNGDASYSGSFILVIRYCCERGLEGQ